MVLRRFFPSLFSAQDSAPVCSRNATLYLMRCIFYMGIRRPPQDYIVIYCLWSLALNLLSTFYQPIGFLLGFISHISEYSAGDFLNSLQVFLNTWTCCSKVLTVWVLVNRFDIANDILDEMDQRVKLPTERRLIHRAVSLSNRAFFCYMTVYMTYSISTCISAVIAGKPPYQNYFPWLNWKASRTQFWLQSILENFSIGGTVLQDATVDCYGVNFLIILRAHMTIFMARLQRLGQDNSESQDERHKKLVDCIHDHRVILRFCDTLRPVISGTIFAQFLVVGLVLGFAFINIALFANLASGIAALSFIIAVLLETTPFCILCSYLTYDCYNLADALFESNWIDADVRYKKTLLQFLLNLQRPITFMAAFLTISVGTNITVTKFAFSVFTLVKQMNLAERFTKAREEVQ